MIDQAKLENFVHKAMGDLGSALTASLVGAGLGARKIDPKWVRVLTALLILYVAVRLALRFREAMA